MKKILQIIALFSMIAILPGCSMEKAAKRMSLELKSVNIGSFTSEGFHADLYMKVDNPNWFPVRVSELRYRMYVAGQEIAAGETAGEIKVPSDGSVVAELPVDVTYGELEDRLLDIVMGKMEYRIEGEAVFKAWIWSYTMPFETVKRPTKDGGKDGGGKDGQRKKKKGKKPGPAGTETM